MVSKFKAGDKVTLARPDPWHGWYHIGPSWHGMQFEAKSVSVDSLTIHHPDMDTTFYRGAVFTVFESMLDHVAGPW